MKRLIPLFLLTALPTAAMAQKFARGADISWYTEMMADGKNFYDTNGKATEINTLMRECGMNAIRLRVWVEPSLGGWCGTADLVEKALAAKAQGHDILVDFHYSDFFADPGRQSIPTAWQGSTLEELANHVAAHTTEVLTALKAAGITPKWVQLGNETRNGMLYSKNDGGGKWSNASGATGSTNASYGGGWANYARLSNAGYDAAKAVFPDVVCMSHLDTRGNDENLSWWFTAFLNAGGKCDMIALSHYPMPWASSEDAATATGKERNNNLMRIIDATHRATQLPVMIVETGVYCEFTRGGKEVMADLFEKCRANADVKGIFYWEPEQYNWWKPTIYNSIGWSNYNMCAFYNNGQPSPILDPWQPTAEELATEGITAPMLPASARVAYDLGGRRTSANAHGITIENGRKTLR